MALQYHPEIGTIVICDFSGGFVPPEMVKRRPAIVVSPPHRTRNNLCTIIPLSTTAPLTVMPYHYEWHVKIPLPAPYNSSSHWVKADMFATVSFSRLTLPHKGRNTLGKRNYIIKKVSDAELLKIRECMLYAVGLQYLTKHL